ncbi:hypothetical protein Slin15195_G094290 [Septoria linicola]|uniref:Uncharacterized protein n=1 Tax=Septoria linicola TaxID=215465 RepID=A0A9Q9B0V2_9PEZI|nr:hypothetical protein Slin15195_G094290 [Septoria linicola]
MRLEVSLLVRLQFLATIEPLRQKPLLADWRSSLRTGPWGGRLFFGSDIQASPDTVYQRCRSAIFGARSLLVAVFDEAPGNNVPEHPIINALSSLATVCNDLSMNGVSDAAETFSRLQDLLALLFADFDGMDFRPGPRSADAAMRNADTDSIYNTAMQHMGAMSIDEGVTCLAEITIGMFYETLTCTSLTCGLDRAEMFVPASQIVVNLQAGPGRTKLTLLTAMENSIGDKASNRISSDRGTCVCGSKDVKKVSKLAVMPEYLVLHLAPGQHRTEAVSG